MTAGCSNNTCTFCAYYGSKLTVRDVGEVKAEIDALALYVRRGIHLPGIPSIVYAVASQWDGRRVFLQDGDALVYPYPKLVEVLEHLTRAMPSIERVAAYSTPQDILRRSEDELRHLKDLKLGILYMGVETGDDQLLESIGKGVNYSQMVAAGRKVKQAGIALSVTVILGLAGIEGSERHAAETARILSDIDPDYAGALVLTPVPGTPIYERITTAEFHPISPFQSLEELRLIVANSRFTACFFSSMHASNYLSVRGWLPADKDRILAELDRVLEARDPRMLRPEFLRGL